MKPTILTLMKSRKKLTSPGLRDPTTVQTFTTIKILCQRKTVNLNLLPHQGLMITGFQQFASQFRTRMKMWQIKKTYRSKSVKRQTTKHLTGLTASGFIRKKTMYLVTGKPVVPSSACVRKT